MKSSFNRGLGATYSRFREELGPSEPESKTMIKLAVIIKNPYRDYDWRVDVYEVPEGTPWEDLRKHVEAKMLGPFQVVGITDRIRMVTDFAPSTNKPITG
jgi:hypothetical protein